MSLWGRGVLANGDLKGLHFYIDKLTQAIDRGDTRGQTQQALDELKEELRYRCRHCGKRRREFHGSDGKCLFEATMFEAVEVP